MTAQGADVRGDRRPEGRPRRARRAAGRPAPARDPVAGAGGGRVPRGPRGGRARAGRSAWARATSCWCAPGTRAAGPSCRRGTRATPRRACIRPPPPSWPSGASRRSVPTATATPLRARTEGVGFPIHVLALNAMGIHLLDYLQFEDLARQCEAVQRWEFLFAAAPLRLVRGTGSPAEPDRDLLGQMLHLRVHGRSHPMAQVGAELDDGGAARHIALAPAVRPGHVLLTAEVTPGAADTVLDFLLEPGGGAGGHHPRATRRGRADRPGSRRREPDLGRRAGPGQAERPAGGALPRLHDRGRRDRGLWRDRGQFDPDRRCDGGEPGRAAGHRRLRRVGQSPLPPGMAGDRHAGDRAGSDLCRGGGARGRPRRPRHPSIRVHPR